MWICTVEFEILMVHESPNVIRICYYQYWERKTKELFQFIHHSRKLMVFHLISPMPSFMMWDEMNVICIYILLFFFLSTYAVHMIGTVSLQNKDTICFIYVLSTCVSLSLLFSASLFSCIFSLHLDWQFDLGACCFHDHNHFQNMLSYMISNQLCYVGGPIRNEMCDGSIAFLKLCDMLVLVALQTSNDVKQSADTQRKNIWKNH